MESIEFHECSKAIPADVRIAYLSVLGEGKSWYLAKYAEHGIVVYIPASYCPYCGENL